MNGFLGIELGSTECFFESFPRLCSDHVAEYLHQVIALLSGKSFEKVLIYLDNNSTHKELMRYNLALLGCSFPIEFVYLPPYSPDMNIVEYLIHLIRQSKLHHGSCTQTLSELSTLLRTYLHEQKPFSSESVSNIINHIREKFDSDTILDKNNLKI